MPAVPVSLLEPVWEQFSVLVPDRPAVSPTHPPLAQRLVKIEGESQLGGKVLKMVSIIA